MQFNTVEGKNADKTLQGQDTAKSRWNRVQGLAIWGIETWFTVVLRCVVPVDVIGWYPPLLALLVLRLRTLLKLASLHTHRSAITQRVSTIQHRAMPTHHTHM